MNENKTNLLNLRYNELEEFILELGMKKFNAKQIFAWLHEKNVRRIDDMTNISAKFRTFLSEKAYIPYLELLKHQVSKIDKTEKFLFELADKTTIETVLIRHKTRNTICVSSQIGCPVKCTFCATGLGGFTRNLELDEILNQVYTLNSRLKKKDEAITNIVYMGMGEPFLNIDNVLDSIDLISSEKGLNISKRKIVISTAGIVPGIEELLARKMPVGLAVSLHACTDEKRTSIIPINEKYTLRDLMFAVKQYQRTMNRRVTFEYILIKDFNISATDANDLAFLMQGVDHTINLIPYNPVAENDFERPSDKKMEKFLNTLTNQYGLNVTLRNERGSDINGACGQLREKQGSQ